MKYRVIQNAFISGELSPKLDARTDIKEYKTGVARLENFLVHRQGGVSRRPGFRYSSDLGTITSTAKVKLLPFIYSKTESYLISIEILTIDSIKIRIFNNIGTKVYDTATTIGGLTGVASGRGLSDLVNSVYDFNSIQSADVLFLTHAEGTIAPLVIARTEADTFRVTPYLTYYFSGIKNPLAQPFKDTNIDSELRIKWSGDEEAVAGTAQILDSYDSVGVGNDDRNPLFRPVPRTGHHNSYIRLDGNSRSFVVQIREDTTGIPALDGLTISSINTSTETITLSSSCSFQVNDIVTFTGTVPLGITAGTEYYIRSVSGADITISATRDGSASTAVNIQTDTSGATCNLIKTSRVNALTVTPANADMASSSITDDWSLGSWSNYQGYPRTVTAFEQRLIWGGSILQPDTVWGSLTGNMFHMMEQRLDQDVTDTDGSGLNYFASAVQSTDPFQFTLASQEVNAIQWMSSQRAIEVGTLGAEYIISGGENAISSTNVQVQVQTNHGGSSVRPVRVEKGTLFISRDGQLVREFKYNNDEGSYITRNFSITSDEILHHGFTDTASYAGTQILDMVYQNSRGILWFVNSNNSLVGCTLDADTGTLGWHRHTIGGVDSVHGIAVIPNSTGTFDDLNISVKRTINGESKYYIEKIGDDFEHALLKNTSTVEDDQPYFSDGSLRIKLSDQTSSITHLGVSTVSHTITFGSNHNLGTGTKFRFSAVGGTLSWKFQTSNAFTANASLDTITFAQIHGLVEDDLIRFSTSATLPAGLSTGTDYQVETVTDNQTIKVKASGGSLINITDTGTGIHRLIIRGDINTTSDYYSIRHNATAIKIAISPDEAFSNNYVDLISIGSGTHTIAPSEGWIVGGLGHLEGEAVEVLGDGFHVVDGFVPRPLQFISSAISNNSGIQFSLPQHDLFPGTKVQIVSSGTLPTGLSSGTDYYVNWVSWDSIRLSTTEAGALADTGLIAYAAGASLTTYTIYPLSSTIRVKDGLVGLRPTYTPGSSTNTSSGTNAGGTVSGAISEAIIGIKYISKLKTMKLEAGQEFGTSQGSLKRNEAVVLKFHKTFGGKFGIATDEENLEEIVFREAGHGMGSALTLFTGDKYLDFPGTAERFFQVVVHQDKPLPMSLLGIIHRGISYD